MTTSKIQKILCPVDFSETSKGALRYAAALASCWRADVMVLHAYLFQPPPYFTEGQIEHLALQWGDLHEVAEKGLREFVTTTLGSSSPPVETAVVDGFAADAISAAASTFGADLIVMGTHGHRGLRRFLLGSVAEHVMHSSQIPVLMVRAISAPSNGKPVIKDILCPVDDTSVSRVSVDYAADIANCYGGTVTLLHVKESSGEDAVADWCSRVGAETSRCEIHELTREGKVAEEILRLSSEVNCDLLVVGAWHRPLLDHTVIGTTTALIVRHANCPVLVVPAKASGA